MIAGTSPAMELQNLTIELDTITPMSEGWLAGGPELLPGLLVQPPPQLWGETSAKPLKASGAAPPLRALTLAHCAPQNSTAVPLAH
jgi:hypothetical protein